MALIALVNLVLLVWDLRQDYQLFGCTDVKIVLCYISSAVSFRIPITVGLSICAAGLWSRRLFGLIVSMVSILLTAEIYREWYAATLEDMKLFGAPTFAELAGQKQILIPLNHARWWDVIVLGAVLVVFLWEAFALVQILRVPLRPKVDPAYK